MVSMQAGLYDIQIFPEACDGVWKIFKEFGVSKYVY